MSDAEFEFLMAGVERIAPILRAAGFEFTPLHSAVSSGGPFANGVFRRDPYEVGLIVRMRRHLGCPEYSDGRGKVAHDDVIWALGREGDERLVTQLGVSFEARDGGDPFAALGWDLENIILPVFARSPETFRAALQKAPTRTWQKWREREARSRALQATRFTQLNRDWNADPNVPAESVRVDGRDVVLEFRVNAYLFKQFEEGQRLRLRFLNAIRFRLGGTNDEGWYFGQCRFSRLAPSWGEFYEVTGDLKLESVPDAWTTVAASTASARHFLFYFRDATFECDAEDWRIE